MKRFLVEVPIQDGRSKFFNLNRLFCINMVSHDQIEIISSDGHTETLNANEWGEMKPKLDRYFPRLP